MIGLSGLQNVLSVTLPLTDIECTEMSLVHSFQSSPEFSIFRFRMTECRNLFFIFQSRKPLGNSHCKGNSGGGTPVFCFLTDPDHYSADPDPLSLKTLFVNYLKTLINKLSISSKING